MLFKSASDRIQARQVSDDMDERTTNYSDSVVHASFITICTVVKTCNGSLRLILHTVKSEHSLV